MLKKWILDQSTARYILIFNSFDYYILDKNTTMHWFASDGQCFGLKFASTFYQTLKIKANIVNFTSLTCFNFFLRITVGSKYRKVASSRPVYYSIFEHLGGATNWDVLLTKGYYKKGYYSFFELYWACDFTVYV